MNYIKNLILQWLMKDGTFVVQVSEKVKGELAKGFMDFPIGKKIQLNMKKGTVIFEIIP